MLTAAVEVLANEIENLPYAETVEVRRIYADNLDEMGRDTEATLQRSVADLLGRGLYRIAHSFREMARAVAFKGRRHHYTITGSVKTESNYWDGGSRSYWWIFDVAKRSLVPVPTVNPMRNPYGETIQLGNGVFAVETTVFCGKMGSLTVYATPEDMVRLIEESK